MPSGASMSRKIARTIGPNSPPGIEDRNADVWEPIVILADLAGGEWPERARAAAIEIVKAGKEREPSLGIRLLADLRTVFAERETMTTSEILVELIAVKEAPWGDLAGKPLNDRRLARRLRDYEIKPKQFRRGDEQVSKGYIRADFRDAWNCYLPLSPDTSGTSGTSWDKQ